MCLHVSCDPTRYLQPCRVKRVNAGHVQRHQLGNSLTVWVSPFGEVRFHCRSTRGVVGVKPSIW